jgi:hypothetical protein
MDLAIPPRANRLTTVLAVQVSPIAEEPHGLKKRLARLLNQLLGRLTSSMSFLLAYIGSTHLSGLE